jgi:hypothetical protein
MRADHLHVVTCVYNPIRWENRIKHAKRFIEQMLDHGVNLTVVECALGRRPHELTDIRHAEHIGVRADTLAWSKESLMNIGVARSKFHTPWIGFVDADVEFRNKNWASDTVHQLQQYYVVQPWSEALDLGPNGEPMLVKGFHVQTSFAKVWHELGDIKAKPNNTKYPQYACGFSYPHPGYAWCFRRDILNRLGGLIEASGLGAGDHQQAMAFIGKIENAIHGQTHPNYQNMVWAWADRAYRIVQGNISFTQGVLEHWFHGEKNLRKYHERWDILIEEKFDPLTDIQKNLDGVVELAGNKPRLRHRFDQYFRQRMEDANVRLLAE